MVQCVFCNVEQIREPTERAICTVLRFSDDEMTKIKVQHPQQQKHITPPYTPFNLPSRLAHMEAEADIPFCCVTALGGSWVSCGFGHGSMGPSRQPVRLLLLMTTGTEGTGGVPLMREGRRGNDCVDRRLPCDRGIVA